MTNAKIHSQLEKLAENPDSWELNRDMAMLCQDENRPEQALIYYKRALFLCGSDIGGMQLNGKILDLTTGKELNRLVLHQALKDILLPLFEKGCWERGFQFILSTVPEDGTLSNLSPWFDTEIMILIIFCQISQAEKDCGMKPILSVSRDFAALKSLYYRLKFFMRRVQFQLPLSLQRELIDFLKTEGLSAVAVSVMLPYMGIDEDSFWERFNRLLDLPPMTYEPVPLAEADYDHTFSFIICVSSDAYFQEILLYIRNLRLPDGYTLEILPIREASSITSGYNAGMRKARGKYKIYLHQDVFLINPDMLSELLNVFRLNPSIGLVGVAGCKKIWHTAVWWEAPKEYMYLNLIQDTVISCVSTETNHFEDDYLPVRMVDGVFMATCIDLPWRDDLLRDFHFYDMSQSLEFQRKGYLVVIPRQESYWCLHDQDYAKPLSRSYAKSQLAFLKEYGEDLNTN